MVTSRTTLFIMVSFIFSSLCKDGYIIQIPNSINITENGSIDVNIVENDLDPYQTLYIDFDDEFMISDAHGREDIIGYTSDSSIVIQADDTSGRSIHYHLPEIPAGSWSGSLGLSIRLENNYPSNILINGRALNQIIFAYAPTYVEFSHDTVSSYDDVIDVSLAQDGSILLYQIDSESKIIISNGIDEDIIANEDMSQLFKDVTTITEVRNIDMLDLSECTDISSMFYGANRINTISGINDLDTSNINNMSYLFAGMTRLRNIDLSDWDVSNVEDMSYMFSSSYISDFSSIEDWNIESVENMNSMFSLSRQLTGIDLSNWNVSNVKDMGSMFASGRRLASIDLSTWNTSGCEDMSSMFESCQSLSSISGISSFDTHNVEDMSNMFGSCIGLVSLDLSNWDTENVRNMSGMFNTTNLIDLGDISDWDVGNVAAFASMFKDCSSLLNFSDLSGWNVSEQCSDLSRMFYRTSSILPSNLDLSSWNVSNVATMAEMFYGCRSIEYLDITGWDTSKLIDASGMFEYDSI